MLHPQYKYQQNNSVYKKDLSLSLSHAHAHTHTPSYLMSRGSSPLGVKQPAHEDDH